MTPRFPIALLALAVALLPVSAFTLAGLCAPIFDWWWTPLWRLLFFLLMVDILLLLVACPLLAASLGRAARGADKTDANETARSGLLAPSLCSTGILLFAGAATYICTRGTCVQLYDQGDYHQAVGDHSRARECYEQAMRLCVESGHDPAH